MKYRTATSVCLAIIFGMISSSAIAKPVTIAGVKWTNFEEALKLADQRNLPILHLQMFGKLDDTFC